MRLNYYLAKYDFVEKHKININSSKEKVFQAIWSLDINKSKIIRILFSLRGFYGMLGLGKKPANLEHIGLSFEELIKKSGFIPLEEVRNQEIVVGLVGKFWQPTGKIQRLKATDFMNYYQTGYGKVAWNLYIMQNTGNNVTLSTETRIRCLGFQAKCLFLLYWMVIRPFSGWIRLEMLKIIKEQAENY